MKEQLMKLKADLIKFFLHFKFLNNWYEDWFATFVMALNVVSLMVSFSILSLAFIIVMHCGFVTTKRLRHEKEKNRLLEEENLKLKCELFVNEKLNEKV